MYTLLYILQVSLFKTARDSALDLWTKVFCCNNALYGQVLPIAKTYATKGINIMN